MHQQITHPADRLGQEPLCRVPNRPTSGRAEGGIEPGNILSLPRVLARIPDVDAAESCLASEPSPTNSHTRLIGQGLSTKLLLGGAFLLVLAAIVPWNLRKNADTASREVNTPVWHASAVPAAADKIPSLGEQAVQTPKAAPSGIGNLRPSKVPPTSPAEVQLSGPPKDPGGNSLNPDRTGYEASRPNPGYYHQPVPEYRQPVPEYRQQPLPEASSNRPMAIGEPVQTPPPSDRSAEPSSSGIDPRWGDAPGVRTDSRHDRGAYQQPRQGERYPVGLADRRMPLPPPTGSGAASVPPGVPGTATFEGKIENPPVKTEYERARPGVF